MLKWAQMDSFRPRLTRDTAPKVVSPIYDRLSPEEKPLDLKQLIFFLKDDVITASPYYTAQFAITSSAYISNKM